MYIMTKRKKQGKRDDKKYTYINNILAHIYLYYKQITLRPNKHFFCLQKVNCLNLYNLSQELSSNSQNVVI